LTDLARTVKMKDFATYLGSTLAPTPFAKLLLRRILLNCFREIDRSQPKTLAVEW